MHPMLLPGLCFLFSLAGSSGALVFAADEGGQVPTARAKLERLLACQQSEKDAALAEKRRIETHFREVQTFRAELTDAPTHRLAVEKAEQALAKDRGALAKVEERLRLAELQIGLTLRAMKYLPTASRDESLPLDEQVKVQFAKWWADRKLASDSEFDKQWQAKYGFVEAPELQARLIRIIERLHIAFPDADPPMTVRIVNRPNEAGASATRSFVYFDKAYLDRNPSDDELLFVAGHELAHVQLHHVSLGAVQAHWQGFEEDWLRKSAEGSHPAYQRPGEHRDAGWRTRMAQYIRDQEAQADLLGAQQALAAGASPRGIKDAFTRMFFDDLKRRLGPDTSGQDPHYEKSLENHARPDVRLKALEDVLGEKFWERKDWTMPMTCRHK
ncbi:MAG: M48 family metalloprotease [Nitrospiraceae bacterium]